MIHLIQSIEINLYLLHKTKNLIIFYFTGQHSKIFHYKIKYNDSVHMCVQYTPAKQHNINTITLVLAQC